MQNTVPQEKLNQKDRRILLVTSYSHFMSHFNMLVFPALALPLSTRLNMELSEVLGLSFMMYLMFGLTALPWGVAADRWGARQFLFLLHAGAMLSALAAAFFLSSPANLALMLTFLGVFSGIYHPVGLGLISKEVGRISMALAINGIFGSMGIAVAPIITGFINAAGGSEAVFFTLAFLNLIGLVLLILFPFSKSPRREDDKTASNANRPQLTLFVILLFAMMCGGIAYRGSTLIMPAYFELKNQALFQWISSHSPWTVTENIVATAITSLIFFAGIFGQYTGGRLAERYDLRYCYLFFHFICMPTAFLIARNTDFILVLLAAIYFFFLLGMQPIENTLVAKFIPGKFLHSAYGSKFILTFGVGALSVQMIEFINSYFGIEHVFNALGVTSLILVGIILLMIKKSQRPAAQPVVSKGHSL